MDTYHSLGQNLSVGVWICQYVLTSVSRLCNVNVGYLMVSAAEGGFPSAPIFHLCSQIWSDLC